MTLDPRGSLWRRWDPHIHAPGTVLNDQFGGGGSIDEYLNRLEAATPKLSGIGITDYLTTRCYEAVVEAQTAGRLPHAGIIFPNIEMRLSIPTHKDKGVNIHLLVGPDDADHLAQLHRFLARLTFDHRGDKFSCDIKELMRLGRLHDPKATDDEAALRVGANQFKVDFRQLKREYGDSNWMQANCLVAVAGSATDGTSGLQTEDASFAALRKEIERFAHIIFASSEKQAKFWRGEGAASTEVLQKEYGGRKPCLHGSDAHCLDDVGRPDLDRLTWLKGDAIFETLRQACLEPGTRVFVGSRPPELLNTERTISEVKTPGADWLIPEKLPINPGLVAVIGARGSGKTALADLIAHGGGNASPLQTRDSFLNRAAAFLTGLDVGLTWSDDISESRGLRQQPDDLDSRVHYLSQQFVERLCSAEGASDELIQEVQRVVFDAHEPATRMEATSFEELLDERVGNTRREREHLRLQLDRISEDVLTERLRSQQLPEKRRALHQVRGRVDDDKKARNGIIKLGETQRAGYYERLRVAIDSRERLIQAVQKTLQRLSHLNAAVDRHRRTVFPDLVDQLLTEFADVEFSADESDLLQIQFKGDPTALIAARVAETKASLATFEAGDASVLVAITTSEEDLGSASLALLKAEFLKVGGAIGIDRQNAQRLKALNAKVSAGELEIEKAQREVDLFEGAEERLRSLSQSRASRYKEYFDLIIAEEEILRDLYRPLEAQLMASSETVGRLRLLVVRNVDLGQWAERGEELIDLRKSGTFKGRGALAEFAQTELVPAWESGSASEVSKAMTAFRVEYDSALVAQSAADRERDPDGYHQWTLDVGRWLYSTDHIEVRYSFEYEDLPLSQLSPGTRGIVLLLLYLALDQEDSRPLVIDQPEENLDPRSVFAELVDLFRRARLRRQVIIVTHNANLVVNTDVDQVIVATCTRQGEGRPPRFGYLSGSLENGVIRAEVCEILEGGEAAFRERARRLRIGRF